MLGGSAEISDFVARNARSGDIVLVMSNGGFDNVQDKILKALAN
jgi:UDP-N-acetylmuramate-alanine ligase